LKCTNDLKYLKWSNGKEWGEINCPMFGNVPVMTYWKEGTPCYDTYTAPFVLDEEIYCYKFDQDEGMWHEDLHFLGEYENNESCRFG
jgi:hypothetical protein